MILQHRVSSDLLEPDFSELYRYAGITDASLIDDNTKNLAEDAASQVRSLMNCRSVYIKFPLTISELLTSASSASSAAPADNEAQSFDAAPATDSRQKKLIQFGGHKLESYYLALNLKDCHEVILFAATLGPEVDRAIQKASRINAAKSVMLQAAGAMFIERYCDYLQDFFRTEELKSGNILCPRFSPGYGDIPLTVQKTFFEILQCQKNLALTLNDSLIMSPEKSVTAFIGIKKQELV